VRASAVLEPRVSVTVHPCCGIDTGGFDVRMAPRFLMLERRPAFAQISNFDDDIGCDDVSKDEVELGSLSEHSICNI